MKFVLNKTIMVEIHGCEDCEETTLEHYRLLRKLNNDGLGVNYLAED